jgi:hypothetical protein
LRLDPARDSYFIAIYFATTEDAQKFVHLFEPGVAGMAPGDRLLLGLTAACQAARGKGWRPARQPAGKWRSSHDSAT